MPGNQTAIASYWELYNGSVVTGNGEKTITAVGGFQIGILLSSGAILTTGDNKDKISGTGYQFGIVLTDSTLNTGNGDDSVTGRGGLVGILNITTVNGPVGYTNGNFTVSTIDTGNGNDRVNGEGTLYGIANGQSPTGGVTPTTANIQVSDTYINGYLGQILTGLGNDKVTGKASYTLGAGIANRYGLINTSIEIWPATTANRDEDEMEGTSTDGRGIDNSSAYVMAVGAAPQVNADVALEFYLPPGASVITTGFGKDKVIGKSTFDAGIFNASSLIDTGSEDDEVRGEGGMKQDNTGKMAHGIANLYGAFIETQDGKDKVIGISKFGDGIHNESASINTGLHGDEIRGTSESGNGILNIAGNNVDNNTLKIPNLADWGIYTDAGIDSITGTTKTGAGIKNGDFNPPQSAANIYNNIGYVGLIKTGADGDRVTGTASGAGGIGISNSIGSSIITEDGDDSVIGTATGADGIGIYNCGLIDTGKGKDTVNALRGGFAGSGTVSLGDDDDTLIGFGTGYFDGGDQTDKILFGNGIYVINASAGTITSASTEMNVTNFEQIGGSSGGLFGFASGTLTVTAGIGVFAPVSP